MTHESSRTHSRRTFLAAASAAASVAAAGQAGAADATHRSIPNAGCYAISAPSNAQGTGVDPNELVLFAFDDFWIPLKRHLTLELVQPRLYDQNPVLRLGKEGEPDACFASMYGTVLRIDGRFRMWYCAVDSLTEFLHPHKRGMRLAYAESDDCVHWRKPKLGLREFHGNKDNNLCALEGDCYNSAAVLYEPDDPNPDRRFKMAYVRYNHPDLPKAGYLCVAFSRDGLTWRDHPANPVVRGTWIEMSGIYRWNGLYYVNGQTSWPASKPKRVMVTFTSADFDRWEEDAAISFYRRDEGSDTGFHDGPQVHLGAGIWHRRNVLLGFYGQWEGPESNQYPDVRMNLGLIISNDGVLFREPVPNFPVVRWGSERSPWETKRILQGNALVNWQDTTYLLYGAGSGDGIPVENQAMVGLATYARDRLGHLRPTAAPASWTSNVLPPHDAVVSLALNVDGTADEARIRVELLDERFQPLPDRAGKSAAIVTKSSLRTPIAFSGDTQQVVCRQPWRVRVHFEGNQAANIRFYALYATPDGMA